MKPLWIEIILAASFFLLGMAGDSATLKKAADFIGPAILWELLDSFYLLSFDRFRERGGEFMERSFFGLMAGMMALLALSLAILESLWFLICFAVLTGRHMLARPDGKSNSLDDFVYFLLAAFPAGFLANVSANLFSLSFDRGLVLFAGFYFLLRAFFMGRWDPLVWMGMKKEEKL